MAETPQKAFRPQILVALYQLGGTASKQATIRRIEELYGSRLSEEDWRPCRTRPEPRWQNLVAWERKDLVRDGLLERGSPRDTWTLTEAGKAEARRT
ncbi:winged helix-turn-helix domain-containing protein [Streptomyces sp. NPDC091412]|uniref:winged helix-turn-helix domain-containing protein n=1 Tax=Streptomyces sp. NPDC091412 TaxID=3366002 RepID=UPI0037F98B35